ncbi:glycoside hydrolase family 3 protein [Nocardioides korecus]
MTGPARRPLAAVTLLAGLTVAAALAAAAPGAYAAPPASPARVTRDAATVLDAMTLPQRVGQLFMVGTPATSANRQVLSQISTLHVGNVMLTGRSHGGTGVPARVSRAVRARATRAATDGVGLLVATDQEGGLVQVLQGPGLSRIPSALTQGGWSTGRLRASAATWGGQLRTAGVNMDLAPVLDTVPSARAAAHNPPIGVFRRELGFTPGRVSSHGLALVGGLASRGVVPTVKHFPGLGRVTANTDTTRGVTDRVTTRGDAYLQPFRAAVEAGVPAVMVSLAYYARIDARNPAVFSPTVIGGVLRHDLGFDGVVVSDDLANAHQVSPWSPGTRAVRFLAAGGDLVLTVNPVTLPAMYRAVLARAQQDPAFRARVDASALRLLTLKQRHGLL